MADLATLLRTHNGAGRVAWIGLRLARLEDLQPVQTAQITTSGLRGDHARAGKRALTLIQAEHLAVISSLAGGVAVTPALLRRNIVVSGINLTALRHNRLRLGTAEIKITVPCAPCSRMEKILGTGGYNAMRGHGGWCAEIVEEGELALSDQLVPIFD